MTTYLVVTPRYVARRRSFPAAAKLAEACERNAQSAHGSGAGADCYAVAKTARGLEFRGLIVGRGLMGRNFGCADGIVARARKAVESGEVREQS